MGLGAEKTHKFLIPVTGRTKDPQTEHKYSELNRQNQALFEDPLEQQFINPEIRGVRQNNQPEQSAYIHQSGVPLYKYRQKYPHYG